MKLLKKFFKPAKPTPPARPAPEPKPEPVVIHIDVAQVTEPEALLKLAAEGPTSQIRQDAVERLQDSALLEQLAKTAQSKDKGVYKIVRRKLDALKAELQQQQELAARAADICDKLDKLSRQTADPLFEARLHNLESEWQLLHDAVPVESAERYRRVQAQCRQAWQAITEAEAAVEQQAAQTQQARHTLETAIAATQRLIGEAYRAENQTALQAEELTTQLQQLANSVQVAQGLDPQVDIRQFEHWQNTAHTLLAQLREHGLPAERLQDFETQATADNAKALAASLAAAEDLPENLQPPMIQAALSKLRDWRAQNKAQEKQQQQQLKALAELAQRGLRAAQHGQVRKARAIHRDVHETKERSGALPEFLTTRIEALDTAIDELSDWHEFAVTPKKQALVEAMKALVQSSLAPADLATRIHELQDEWKLLSKGVQQADEALWMEFQQAAQAAFAPCKEFFEAQAAEREQNLARRQTLIQQVQTYLRDYHWDTAIWKDVEQALKVAREEWKSYWPVPRKAGNDVQKTFDALMDELHGKLSAEYQRNKTGKSALVDDVRALIEHDDLQHAIEAAKQLQSHWKTLGRTWPRDEQQLWKQFRKACDDIFARRKAQQEANQAEYSNRQETADALLQSLNALLEHSGQALLEARAEAESIKVRFQELGELPAAQAKKFRDRLHQGLRALEDKIATQRRQADAQRWDQLLMLSEQLRSAELSLLATSTDESTLAAVQEALAQAERLPQDGRERLANRLVQAQQLSADLQSDYREALRVLCIRAEILTGQPTPDSDREARMRYQVQQLQQQGLGQAPDTLEQLILAWITVPAVTDSDYTPLRERFERCRQAV